MPATIPDALLPRLALAVRQPWAYAVAMGWKPIENRGWRRPNPDLRFRGPFCILAPTGMTRAEYDEGYFYIRARGFEVPPARELKRGGIIGIGRVDRMLHTSDSPWFEGPIGIVIVEARPVEFVPAAGQLGFFEWRRAGEDFPPAPAQWMLPHGEPEAAPDLFEVKR